MIDSLACSVARWCAAPAAAALAHLSSAAGMARWNLGLQHCREVEPGLFTGESLFDGRPTWVRLQVDAQRGVVDYQVGGEPQALAPRIRATVIAGELLGYADGSCVVTLEAWRTAGMADARWRQLVQTLETEVALVCAQLGAPAVPPDATPPATVPARARRRISSGSPWEALAGYSRAVVDGDWVFVSGTVGLDFTTMTMPPSADAQAHRALDTIERALLQAGASLDDVVRVRVFVPQRDDVAAVSGVLKERLGPASPTNTTLCSPLPVEGARVEIEVTARRQHPPPTTAP
ncbi:MAG: RidA family protein [Rhodoferax sp.]